MSNSAGDFEQQRQQSGHRDLVGGAGVDRLADGADRLGEILDAIGARHVARLEMHLGDPQIVVADEAVEDLGEKAALLAAEPAHDAEIERDDAALGVDEEIALMHVGVEEAVAQGVAQEGLDQLAPERGRIEAELPSAPGSLSGVPSIHSIVRTSRVVRSQSIFGARKSGIVGEVLAEFAAAAASSRKSISMRTERASVSTTSTGAAVAVAARTARRARGEEHVGEVALKRRSTPGRSSLTATSRSPSASRTRARCTCAIEAARDRLAELDEERRRSALERRLDALDRGRAGRRRHAILQPLQLGGDLGADDVGPGGEKLAELDIGRPQPVDRARQSRRGRARRAARGNSASASGSRASGGSVAGSTPTKAPSRASMKPARASRENVTRSVRMRQVQSFQPEWIATTPPVRRVNPTRAKPAAAIMSAKRSGAGNCRIDSTR